MSGRGLGGKGLGRFVRTFDEKETIPLFLRVLPKKYHDDFQAANINEKTLHTMINHLFEGIDVRDELASYMDMPPRYRFVQVKETRPLYEKLCKDYQKKEKQSVMKEKVVIAVKQQKVSIPKQKTKQENLNLNCACKKLN